MPEKKSLADQVIVVTGASSGLGRAVARLAGRHGAKVVVTPRGYEALDGCVREIEASGSEALAAPADCAVGEEAARVGDLAVERFGRIARAVRRGCAPLLRAPGARAAGGLGRAEAHVGREAVAAPRRP